MLGSMAYNRLDGDCERLDALRPALVCAVGPDLSPLQEATVSGASRQSIVTIVAGCQSTVGSG